MARTIDEKDPWYLFIFFVSQENGSGLSRLDDEYWFKAINYFVWSDFFNYGDFKELSVDEQATLLWYDNTVMLGRATSNSTPEFRKNVANLMREKWLSSGESALHKSPFNKLSDTTPFFDIPSKVNNYLRKQIKENN